MPAPFTEEPRFFLHDHGTPTALDSYRADQLALLAAGTGTASLRLWSRPQEGVQLGRFHRIPDDGPPTMERRSSGGRVVPVGPGILGMTLVVPSARWLEAAGRAGSGGLRPDQILNRALRPLLGALRAGVGEVFYPGRDLIVMDGAPIAHASFTVLPDGVCMVEAHVALTTELGSVADRLTEADPDGVVGFDRGGFAGGSTLERLCRRPPSRAEWLELFRGEIAGSFLCEVRVGEPEAAFDASDFVAAASGFEAFLREPGPLPAGHVSAVAPSMLGLVECSARLDGDCIFDLTVTGDVIAPFLTLERLRADTDGIPFRMPLIRKALTRVLGAPRSFLLGVLDLDALIERLGS